MRSYQERVDVPVSPSERNKFESLKLEEFALEGVAVIVPIEYQCISLEVAC